MKLSAIAYAIVILAFFMPFFMVSCQETELLTISGIQLVTGGESKLQMDDLMGAKGTSGVDEEKNQKIKAQPLAIAAFLLAIISLAVVMVLPRKMYYLPILLSFAGIACLHLLKNGMGAVLAKTDIGMGSSFDMGKILSIRAKMGFWVADLAFLAAAVSSLILGMKKDAATNYIPQYSADVFQDTDTIEPLEYTSALEAEETEEPIWNNEDNATAKDNKPLDS